MSASELRVYLDESGTGLDLSTFILAGVAAYGQECPDGACKAWKSQGFDRTDAKLWTEANFLAFVEFLLQHNLLPVGVFATLSPELLTAAAKKASDLVPTRIRLGAPILPDRTTAPSWEIYRELLTALLLNMGHVAVPHFREVQSLTFVLDRHTMPAWQKRELADALGQFDSKILRRMSGHLASLGTFPAADVEQFVEKCTWSSPTVVFDPAKELRGLTKAAHCYCTLLLRDIQGRDDLVKSAGTRLISGFHREPHLLSGDVTQFVLSRVSTGWEASLGMRDLHRKLGLP